MDLVSAVIRDRRVAASEETLSRQRSRRTGELLAIHAEDRHGRRIRRSPGAITTIVLHQTAGPRFLGNLILTADDVVDSDHPIDRIASHFAITADGIAMYIHDVEFVMNNAGGRFGIDIEVCGRFSTSEAPSGERLNLTAIRACRQLIADLVAQIPSISHIHPHGQVETLAAGSDADHGTKWDSCCGPDVWVNIGQWAVDRLQLDCDSTLGYPNHGISPRQTNQAYRQAL